MDARELPRGGHHPRDSVESLDLLGGYTDVPETSHASADPFQHNHHRQHYHHYYHHQQSQSSIELPQDDTYYGHYDDYSHYTHLIEDNEPRDTGAITSTRIDDDDDDVAAVQPPTTNVVTRALPLRSQDYSSAAASTRPVSPGHVRSQTLTPVGTPALYNTNAIKRKPLSSASPLAIHSPEGTQSLAKIDLPRPEARFSRPFQADSPTLYEHPVTTIQPYRPDPVSPLAGYHTSVEGDQ